MDDTVKFEARTCNLALEESSFGGGWASPSPRRLDYFLQDLHGASSAHGRRDLKFSKWQTKILQHSIGLEVRRRYSFDFKHR